MKKTISLILLLLLNSSVVLSGEKGELEVIKDFPGKDKTKLLNSTLDWIKINI